MHKNIYRRSGNFHVAFFHVRNVHAVNFHRVAFFRVRNVHTFNFRRLSNWRKMFNGENFPIYGKGQPVGPTALDTVSPRDMPICGSRCMCGAALVQMLKSVFMTLGGMQWSMTH